MAQSLEYPDLRWMPPKAFGTGRDGKAVRYIVIHYTAGAERNTSAEDGAAADARRTDGVSTHYFVDSDSVVQCVLTKDRANAARHRGNRLGIQYELCGTVQTRAQWLDAASLPTLRNAARQVARDCRKYAIPVRRLSVAETRAAWYGYPSGPKGIVGHVDCTNAYPEDGGDHTDPGAAFPWAEFLDMIRDELEDDVAAPTAQEIAKAVWSYALADPQSKTGETKAAGTFLRYNTFEHHQLTGVFTAAAGEDLKRDTVLAAALQALPGAVAAELADDGSVDAVVVQAAVERALSRLQLTVLPEHG